MGVLNEDPLKFIKQVEDTLKELGMFPEPENNNTNVLPEWEGVPEQFVKQYQEQGQKLSAFEKEFKEFNQSQQEREQIAALDRELSKLHNAHGDFDDEWVLLQMQKGLSPEDAVKKFQDDIVKKYGSSRKPAPNLVTSAGSVPSNQVDISKMTPEQRRAYAISRLEAANAANS